MDRKEFKINDRDCILYICGEPKALIVQPSMGFNETDEEVSILRDKGYSFALVSFKTRDWNRELSPWEAPPVFGKEGFGSGADETLSFVLDSLIPEAVRLRPLGLPIILCGYSLAGLFALYGAVKSDAFYGACGVSPSVWFPGWLDYSMENGFKSKAVYLSLGNKEAKTKNKVMAAVADCIEKEYEFIKENGKMYCTFEWNEGNHVKDSQGRTAKGLAWCLDIIGKEK